MNDLNNLDINYTPSPAPGKTETQTPSIPQQNGFDTQEQALTIDTSSLHVEKTAQNIILTHPHEKAQGKIAFTFTIVFLSLIGFSITIPFITNVLIPNTYQDTIHSAKELSTTLASILAAPFGFILGFYFKKQNEE